MCDPPQYLVNVPEGYARLALEHRVRPDGRLRAVLATGLSPSALVGGTSDARRTPSSAAHNRPAGGHAPVCPAAQCEAELFWAAESGRGLGGGRAAPVPELLQRALLPSWGPRGH